MGERRKFKKRLGISYILTCHFMYLSDRHALQFGFLASISALLMLAVLAHGLWWENDPFWTYWVTQWLLLAASFIVGTIFMGVGVREGVILTCIQGVIHALYYTFLRPMGLPLEPWYAAFRDLWTSGFVTHSLAVLSGYLIALWIWWRKTRRFAGLAAVEKKELSKCITFSLLSSGLIAVVDAFITQGVLARNFFGFAFLIERFLLLFLFIAFWDYYVGFDHKGILTGSLIANILMVGWAMYGGPRTLSDGRFEYLDYSTLWFVLLPGGIISMLAVLSFKYFSFFYAFWRMPRRAASTISVFLLFILFPILAGAENVPAGAWAEGRAHMVIGSDPYDITSTIPVTGTIEINIVERSDRSTPLQKNDSLKIVATVVTQTSTYEVRIYDARRLPRGDRPHWGGVALHQPMHGNTGIGTNKIPKVTPQIAVWGLAEVHQDGRIIAKKVLAHAMVIDDKENGPFKGMMLDVGAEDKNIRELPDGYLTLLWPQVSSIVMPRAEVFARRALAWILLALTVAVFWRLAEKEERLIFAQEN